MSENALPDEEQPAAKIAVALLLTALLATLWVVPLHAVPFHYDDWSYLGDLGRQPLWRCALAPASGHFMPISKFAYGGLLQLTGFNSVPISFIQWAARVIGTLLLALTLRRAGCLTSAAVLVLLAAAFNEVGIRGVFRWPWEFALETCLLSYSVAIYAICRYFELPRPRFLGMAVVAAACTGWSFGAGVALTATIAGTALLGSFLGPAPREAKTRTLTILLGAVAASVLVTTIIAGVTADRDSLATVGGLSASFHGVLRYFAYLYLVNSSPSGLLMGVTPGVVNAIFTVICSLTCLLVLTSEAPPPRKLCAAALVSGHAVLTAVIAVSRWQYGIQHTGSSRYVYTNIWFQMPMLAIALQELNDRCRPRMSVARALARSTGLLVAMGIFALAFIGGIQGKALAIAAEDQQRACIDATLTSVATPPCLSTVCGKCSGDLVRATASVVDIKPRGGSPEGGAPASK